METHSVENFTPDERARALRYFFGWQGGTIHQLVEATGLPSNVILYDLMSDLPLTQGFCAVRTCDLAWRRTIIAPKHKGDRAFWRDVIKGFWATGPLDNL